MLAPAAFIRYKFLSALSSGSADRELDLLKTEAFLAYEVKGPLSARELSDSLNAAVALVEWQGVDAMEPLHGALETMSIFGWRADQPFAAELALRVWRALVERSQP